jgi:hypothetical protein
MSEANDFLMGGGTKSASFPEIGASVTGTIVREPEVQQQRDFKTGELKFWDDGKPMQQLKVVLATDQRDPSVDDDKGERAVYVKARMQKAVRDAVRASGAPGLQVGGQLTVTFVAEEPTTGGYPPKLYTASYVPAPNAQVNDFLNGGQPTQAPAPAPVQAAPVAAPVYAQPAAPVAAPAAVPAGVDPALAAAVANLSDAQKAALGMPV